MELKMNNTDMLLPAAELAKAAVDAWCAAEPLQTTSDFAADCRRYTEFWRLSRRLFDCLPTKAARNVQQAKSAESIHAKARDARQRFLRQHVEAVYADLTEDYSRFLRVEALVFAAA